ncbi:CPBP family intramembrane glutamic endopeptidase [Sphingobacterium paludis]|uniref:CAAX prenyl protease 2/Lysostaphin resistance protein A-like domain-containing protein n=1 Tax=Sphingobacterium paludis TaxID=1476465 RepID=A0A4R7D235_9SPHI|nr:CPBP family intramembrane glutamic endopeptidase [Sphingobacterium paludis]TDS14820.1 hypothetical protein B0I21_103320 [Sphingobacterium paludis]
MNVIHTGEKSPWSDLLLLFGMAILFTVLLQLFILIISFALGQDVTALLSGANRPDGETSFLHYMTLASGSVGSFLLPAYFLQLRRPQYTFFPSNNVRNVLLYLFPLVFLSVSTPLMSLLAEWNMQMKLPEAFDSVEGWMRTQEDAMGELTAHTVMVTTWDKLVLNIIVIAVLPAIGEEFFFRGSLQHIFQRVLKNHHATIWIVGTIFSAIHFQFYGFFPRLFLGVVFGYTVWWTGNIWSAVLAHFVNNASVVLLAFHYARQGKAYSDLTKTDSYAIIMYLGSFVFSIIIALVFYQYAKKKKLYGKRLG